MLHPVPAPKAPARPRLLVRRLTRPGLFLLVAAAGTSALLGPGAAASAATPSHGAHSTLDSGTASNGGKHATIAPAYSTGNSGQHLGRKPKATPTPGPTATPYPTPTATPATTATPSPTNTPAPPPPATPRPTATPVPTPQPTSQPTATPRPTATPVPTPQPTPQPTATPSPTGAPSSTATPGTGSPAKGMAAHFMWQSLADTNTDLDRMQAAGMSYVRFDVSWRNSEPTKGSYLYLDKLDQVISAVQSRGMTLTMTVIETPSWANGGAGMFAPPSNPADYASFMGVLARRYAGRAGMVWEIWNEENDAHFWTTGPNAAQYTAMLKPAYAAVKQADPDATVIVGGILFNNTAFLDGIYANGGGSSFDGIAIHPYTINRAPGDTSSTYYGFANSVPQFRTVFANHGQTGKPIWITELGWSTSVVSDATRATWFRDAVGIARSWTDVRGIAAYTIRQSQFAEYGLFTTAGVPTASWTAYAAAQ